jgi:hypothetical protein
MMIMVMMGFTMLVVGRVGMGMFFPQLPIFLSRQILLPVNPHIHLRSGNPATHDARNLQPCSYVEGRDRLLERLRRNSGVDQSAHKHVAAHSGKTLKVGYAHRKIDVDR